MCALTNIDFPFAPLTCKAPQSQTKIIKFQARSAESSGNIKKSQISLDPNRSRGNLASILHQPLRWTACNDSLLWLHSLKIAIKRVLLPHSGLQPFDTFHGKLLSSMLESFWFRKTLTSKITWERIFWCLSECNTFSSNLLNVCSVIHIVEKFSDQTI